MASRRNYFPSQIHFSSSADRRFEFQESDLWSFDEDRTSSLISPPSPEPHQYNNNNNSPISSIPPPRSRKRSINRKSAISVSSPSSLPVNIPDWSKILGGDIQDGDVAAADGSDFDDVDDRVPPHEYAARQVARRSGMVAAFSVQEGVGRTLKGRDLRRVRNAIWKQTGFED